MIVFVVLIIRLMLSSSSCHAACLGVVSCQCEIGETGVIINCRNQNLDIVPDFQNSDTIYQELTLENNAIQTIDDNAFAMIKVRRIVLANNPIGRVSDKAFSNLTDRLTELILQVTSAASFPTVALQPLVQLQSLELIGYGKPSLPSGALSSLVNLQTLRLISGGLQNLSASDFANQQNQLLTLDLMTNQFAAIPASAINALKSLTKLDLSLNGISAVSDSSFSELKSLQALDLSGNNLATVGTRAFSGLETCLLNLTMQRCRLQDGHLLALKRLSALRRLDVSDNEITSIVLMGVPSLQELHAARNQITLGSRLVYRSFSSSLLILDLSDNPITSMDYDSFTDFTRLQELYLDGARGLQLNDKSFVSQRTSLKILSLRSANLSMSQWSSINNITGLQTLWMSSCGLGDIPDFTFRVTNQLENLDLSDNDIGNVTQRSLTGLEYSLIRLYLSRNKLTTLDECIFHRFAKIDILQLQLNFNPLRCGDCSLEWLHDRLQPLKTNPNTTFRTMSLRWTCDDGRYFNTLTDDDFSRCMPTMTVCEDLAIRTTPLPDQSNEFFLTIVDITSTTITVLWNITSDPTVQAIAVRYRVDGGTSETAFPLTPDTTNYTLSDLAPSTTYVIDVEVVVGNVTASSTVRATTADDVYLNLAMILGVAIGLGVAFLILVVIVVLIIVKKSEQKKSMSIYSPQLGGQTKRFVKANDGDQMSSPASSLPRRRSATTTANNNSDDVIVQTIETMTEEEKYRLVNLLTNSRGSLDALNMLGGGRSNDDTELPGWRHHSSARQHIYEEIPDDYYEEIPTDDTV